MFRNFDKRIWAHVVLCDAYGWVVLLVATMVYAGFLKGIGEPLVTFQAPLGIVSFELPADADASRAMIKAWEDVPPTGVTASALRSLRWDFGFAVVYTVMFAGSWLLLYKQSSRRYGQQLFSRSMLIPAGLMVLAGLLDWAENGILLRMLRDPAGIGNTAATVVWWCASIKFGLILLLGVPGALLAITFHRNLHALYSCTIRPWFEWFARYPALAIVAGVIFYVTSIPAVESPGLGLQYLFWHDDRAVQWQAGLALGVLLLELSIVGYFLDAEEKWLAQIRSGLQWWRLTKAQRVWKSGGTSAHATGMVQPESPSFWNSVRYVGVTGGILWLTVVARALDDYSARKTFLKAVTLSFVLYWFSWICIFLISRLFAQSGNVLDHTPHWLKSRWGKVFFRLPKDPVLQWLHVLGGAWMLLIVLVAWLTRGDGQAASAICTLLIFATAVYGRVVYMFPTRWIGWLAVGFMGIVVTSGVLSYPHQFEGLEPYYKTQNLVSLAEHNSLPIGLAITKARDADFAQLQKWRERHPNEKPKLIVVAVSGGGIRAAVWTATALAHLERNIPDFHSHMRVVTGTSGGMLGASYYVATVPAPGDKRQLPLDELVENTSQESLSAAAQSLLSDIALNIPKTISNASGDDRGKAVERRWRQVTGDELGKTFGELAPGESEGWRPTLVFAPMLVEDGRRLLISNLDFTHLITSEGSLTTVEPPNAMIYSRSAVQFFELFPDASDRLMLGTAVRMNASFPYISPAGVLPTIPPRRVVDAGYYDNYGVNVGCLWIDDLARSSADWLRENTSGIILIQINDHPTVNARLQLSQAAERPRSQLSRGQDWLATPAHAVLSARDSTMHFRNDEQIEQLDRLLNKTDKNFFTTIVFEFTGHVSLSWYLAKTEVAQLRYCMEGNSVDRLLEQQLRTKFKLPESELRRIELGLEANTKKLAQLIQLLAPVPLQPALTK